MLAPSLAPCRIHLVDLLMAIPPKLRNIAHWRCTEAAWDAIRHDPDLKSNWEQRAGEPLFYGIPVHLNGHGRDMELIIPATCVAGEGVHRED
jgi:hypothetical protein